MMPDAITSERTDSQRTPNGIEWFNGDSSNSHTRRWGLAEQQHRLSSVGAELLGRVGSAGCWMVLPANYRYGGNASSGVSPFVQEFYATTPENDTDPLRGIKNWRVVVPGSPTNVKIAVTTGLSPSGVLSPAAQPEVPSLPASPVVDPMGITRQLTDLRNLRDGWADGMQPAHQWGEGYGKAPSAAGLDWLIRQFGAKYDIHLPCPYLYPTPEGGVQAEWSLGDHEVSLEIDLIQHTGNWHSFDLRTNKSTERALDLDDAGWWEWLADQLLQLEPDGE